MLGTSNNHMCAKNATSVSLNSLFAESLGKLETIMSKRGDAFRAKAYKKAQETILKWPGPLTNVSELKGAPGIGASVFDKLLELFQTGVISLIEEEKNNPINLLSDVYGIGPKKAAELVNVHGVTSIEQLRIRSELLNDVQRVGLKYYEDILQRIPRAEIQEYEKAFSLAATKCVGTTFEIVGSYRRGAAHSGDIDAIITSIDVGAFRQFVDHLIREKVILEVLSRGDCKCLVIARLPGHAVARRVDFLFSSKEEYAFAILYFTGSKAFNTNMRQKALDMGYSLNEHCISALINGTKVPVSSSFPTEKHIFDFLKMEYVVPSKRGDVASVLGTTVIKTKKNVTKKRSVVTSDAQKSGDVMVQTMRAEGFINKVFDKYDETQLKTLLKEANHAYHNVVPFLSDAEFDALEAYIVGRFGSSGLSVGAPVPAEAGGKATLPYKMASMNKIKPGTGALASWKQSFDKGPFVLSSKLDGVSGLFHLCAGSAPALYTRGDGETGQDIRFLIPYLGIPMNHDLSRGDICVRGEFIISKDVFDQKYKTMFANPRNMVAGLINHKHMDAAFHEKIKDVHFVAYEVIHPVLKPSDQFVFLKGAGFECAYNHLVTSSAYLTEERLSQVFGELKSGYLYETDGVIVCEDKVHNRPSGVSNPEYAFAFKMAIEEQMTRARVVAVHWSASKDGYLKPRVQIEPVSLCGVKIEYATGFNAAFIVQHRVGTGAVIEIIRSGDVIPHIKQVISPATLGAEAGLPTDCEYEWNETGVDIVLKNADQDEGVVEKNVALFFAGMGVDGIGAGVVKKLCKAGFNSVPKIIHMTKEEMAGIDGLGEKSAFKIKESISAATKKAEMVTWAAASNIFGRGFGERKMAPILEMYPNILLSNDSKEEKIKQVLQVKGIAEKSASAFVENIARFNAFFVACNGPNEGALPPTTIAEPSMKKDVSHALYNKTVVLTGFRDKDFMQRLKEVGAIQGATVSKNTFAVVVKNEGESSSKISNAKSLGVPIFFLQDFLTKFFI
jgi:DNA ligase (NAD+)